MRGTLIAGPIAAAGAATLTWALGFPILTVIAVFFAAPAFVVAIGLVVSAVCTTMSKRRRAQGKKSLEDA